MQDIVVKDLYNRLIQLRNAFLQYQNDFNAIDNILRNNVFSDNSINVLRNITFRYKLNDTTSKFISNIISDITVVKEKYDAIKEKKSYLQNKLSILEDELKKRGLPSSNFVISMRCNITSLNELNKYYKQLLEDEIRLNKIMSALNVEKQKEEESSITTLEEKVEICDKKELLIEQEELKQNVNNYLNPDEDSLMSILHEYSKTDGFEIKIINNDGNSLTIELENINSASNEKPKTTITFTNISDSNYEFLWKVISYYADANNVSDEIIKDGIYKNVSDNGNILELNNFSNDNISTIQEYVKKIQTNNTSTSNNLEVSVDDIVESENENNNVILKKDNDLSIAAKIGPNILMMLVLVGILVASVFIANGIFNFLKI